MAWILISSRLLPTPPVQTRPTTDSGVQPTTRKAGETQPASGPAERTEMTPAAASSRASAPTTTAGSELVVPPGGAAEIVSIGDVAENGPFPMKIVLTSRGAAISEVYLRGARREVGKPDPYPLLSPVQDPVTGRVYDSFATERLRIETFRQDIALSELPWQVDRAACTDKQAVFRVTVHRDGRPVVEVAKTYTLTRTGPISRKGAEALESRRYDVRLEYALRNLTADPLEVILTQRGPIGLHQEDPRSDDRAVMAALGDGTSIKVAKKHQRKEIAATRDKNGVLTHPVVELGRDQGQNTLAWAADANRYFACIVRPERGDGGIGIAQAQAVSLTDSEDAAFSQDITFSLVTTPIRLDAEGTTVAGFALYLGPKSKTAFERIEEYAKYNYFATVAVDFYCCAPAPVARFMMWLLQVLYWPTRNYGLAIILLVLIVRTILHPITKAGQVNMVKMQKMQAKLQPKVEELKKKYANDRAKLNEEIMTVYREAGVSPASQMLTCLPMALQIPIWAGLWAALSSTVEMRHAPFDGYWIKDLAAPDALISFGRAVDIPLVSYLTGPIHSFNLLPILLTVTMYLQQRFMPKASAAVATQASEQLAQQQKMMNFMTIFFGLMFYSAPSGLNLYIMASNLGGILEQWRIRKHIEVLEERAKNAPPGTQDGLLKKVKKPRFWSWLEKRAEEAKRVSSSRDRR